MDETDKSIAAVVAIILCVLGITLLGKCTPDPAPPTPTPSVSVTR